MPVTIKRKNLPDPLPDHDGETYVPTFDRERLNAQTQRVYDAVLCGRWMTLRELSEITGDPEASVSARLRDLRKPKFGGFVVERQRVGNVTNGLFQYRLITETV